jgi:hypothetical protein
MLKFSLAVVSSCALLPGAASAQNRSENPPYSVAAPIDAPVRAHPDFTKPPYRAARAPSGPVEIPPPPQTEPSDPTWGGERYRVLQDPADKDRPAAPVARAAPEKIGPAYTAPSGYKYVLHQYLNSWGGIMFFSPTGKSEAMSFSQVNNVVVNTAPPEIYKVPLKIVSVISQPGADYLLIQAPIEGISCGESDYAVVSNFYSIHKWGLAANSLGNCNTPTQFYADQKMREIDGQNEHIDELTIIFSDGEKWQWDVQRSGSTRGLIK